MRVLHISDMHFGGEDQAAVAAVTRFVARKAPDLIIASGDLSLLGLPGELEAAFAWLGALGPPVVATPGNHDVPYHELFGRLYKPFSRYERARAGRARAGWESADLAVVTINSARGWQVRPNWALGAVSRHQIHDAARALRRAPVGALRIVVTHHPLLFPEDSPIHGRTRGGGHAARALIGAGAQIFLAGHLHVTQETRVRGDRGTALALAAGTLSLRLRGEPAGFQLLEFTDAAAVAVTRYEIIGGEAVALRPDTIALA